MAKVDVIIAFDLANPGRQGKRVAMEAEEARTWVREGRARYAPAPVAAPAAEPVKAKRDPEPAKSAVKVDNP